MFSRSLSLLPASFLVCSWGLLSGCAGGNLIETSNLSSSTPQISGVVRGGQQPITGATIQLYAANLTTNQGASTPLLTSAVTTDSNGNFTITNDYTCPATNPPVYLVSSGGNPGLSAGTNNTDIVLMASLGLCSTLTSSTYVVINEITTVGMTYLLGFGSYMLDAYHIGASPTGPDPGDMYAYFADAVSYNDEPTGLGGTTLAAMLFNTDANILSACVNSPGGSSGDGSACGNLLQNSGGVDTATAALKITGSPSSNASQLYGLIPSVAPFQPYFSAVPSDFANSEGTAYPTTTRAGTIDSNGHLWLYTGGYTYNPVTNVSTDNPGIITVYDTNLNVLFTVASGTGGLYYPATLAADASGHVFAVNANNTISEFSSTGAAISSAGGWSTGVSSTFTGTGTGDAYQTNSTQVGPIKIDSQGTIWGKTQGGAGDCYFELNSSGTLTTPTTETGCAVIGGAITNKAAAPDGLGNLWATGSAGLVQINSTGSVAETGPSALGCFAEFTTTGNTSYNSTLGLLYDNVHSQVWGYSYTGAGGMTDGGTLSFCDATTSTMPAFAPPSTVLFTTGNPVSLNTVQINSVALDGAGNLWFTTNGIFASGTATSTTKFNGTVTHSAWLGEISPTGTVLSPFNASTNTYGYQPAGLGMNVLANVTGAGSGVTIIDSSLTLLGIDNAGNIWAVDTYTERVLKISGLATANTLNY